MKDPLIFTTQKSISFLKDIVKYLPINIKEQLPNEIGIITVSAQESLRLNRMFRSKRKPTNVLSFLYSREYGEIILCPEIIRKEAKQQGNTQVFQMTWMCVHGMLHLAGLHHEKSDAVARKITRIEDAILQKIFNSMRGETKD